MAKLDKNKRVNFSGLEIECKQIDIKGADGLLVNGTAILGLEELAVLTAAEIQILDGATVTTAELNYLDIATLGTGAASKAVVLDANGDYTYPATGTIVYPSGATLTLSAGSTFNVAGTFQIGGTAVNASAAEINRVADTSARLVAVGGTSLAVTQALHDGKIILMDHTAAESTLTLPAATGTGSVFRMVVSAVNTNNHKIVTASASDLISGAIHVAEAGGTVVPFSAGASDDTITLNGTTSGGADVGDWIELIDIATNLWVVKGQVTASGCEVTPFSSSD